MPLSASVRAHWASITAGVRDLKSDRIVAVLEYQILSGKLATGTMLPTEAELGQILGVSRTVLRDAVRTLAARGLLLVRQGRGTMVAEPSDHPFANAMVALLARSDLSMREVMQTRRIIETVVVGIAAEAGTDEDWQVLDDDYEALRSAVSRGAMEEASRAHSAFHAGILRAAHQPALALLLTPMNQIAVLTGVASVRKGWTEDWEVAAHLPILQALKQRDPDAAVQAMGSHFDMTMQPNYDKFLDLPFALAYFD